MDCVAQDKSFLVAPLTWFLLWQEEIPQILSNKQQLSSYNSATELQQTDNQTSALVQCGQN
jgi:hypothetical protein